MVLIGSITALFSKYKIIVSSIVSMTSFLLKLIPITELTLFIFSFIFLILSSALSFGLLLSVSIWVLYKSKADLFSVANI